MPGKQPSRPRKGDVCDHRSILTLTCGVLQNMQKIIELINYRLYKVIYILRCVIKGILIYKIL